MKTLKLSGVTFIEGPGLARVQESWNDGRSVHFHLGRRFDSSPLPDCFPQTSKGGAGFGNAVINFGVNVCKF